MSTLIQHIRQDIEKQGGAISFARFMELALYTPDLGYYNASMHKIGKEGDFVTAPEISPLFARCIARQCQQVLSTLNHGNILEIGGGTGIFAKDLLLELEKLNSLPKNYYILDVSPDLRDRQQQLLSQQCPHLFPRIHWLNTLPSQLSGIIFANEVMDAMPIHYFHLHETGLKEKCVTWKENGFKWVLKEPTTEELTQRVNAILQECPLPLHYESEVNLMLPAWIHSLANTLTQGLILLFDYGYGRREYYLPDRTMGTLMCYHQHQRHSDPLSFVGLQDITAHVDFTSVAESAVDAGLTFSGYTTQTGFLLATGLTDLAQEGDLTAYDALKQNNAIKTLTLPSQMGELIKAAALTKNYLSPLIGFGLQDRRRDV